MEGTADSLSVSNDVRMVFPSLPVGDATLEQLQDRVQSTIRAENQLSGIRAEVLAEMTREEGVHLAESDLRETGLRARRKTRSEVETAQVLEELPQTSERLRKGKIPHDNARILAKESQQGEIDENDLVEEAHSNAAANS